MARWFFEPGHTSAEFSVRHMMVTEVRGHFKNVHGWMKLDDADPARGSADRGGCDAAMRIRVARKGPRMSLTPTERSGHPRINLHRGR